MSLDPVSPNTETPFPGEIAEAKRTPGGWVYRIAGKFGPKDRVPPEAIVGAWKVDANGNISGANPEVLAFRKEHNIRPIGNRYMGPGDAGSPQPVVTGELNDITVSQALDHVLKTFPGFWIYENCVNEDGQRTVYFSFLKRIPVTAHKE